jgi:hypothetical protein
MLLLAKVEDSNELIELFLVAKVEDVFHNVFLTFLCAFPAGLLHGCCGLVTAFEPIQEDSS